MESTSSNSTSTRLRQAVQAAAAEFHCPVAGHELEKWIAEHDPPMAEELSRKCYDSIRIILSLTSEAIIAKFTCTGSIPGVDLRSRFYGSANMHYDPNMWIPVNHRTKKDQPGRISLPPKAPRGLTLVNQCQPRSPSSSRRKRTSHSRRTFLAKWSTSWFVLTTLYSPASEFWSEFTPTLNAIKARVAEGVHPATVIQQLLRQNKSLTHSAIAEYVIHILSHKAAESTQLPRNAARITRHKWL
jgi:hypothetical protein